MNILWVLVIEKFKGDIMVKENWEAVSSLQIQRNYICIKLKINNFLLINETNNSDESDEESKECYLVVNRANI